MPSRATDIGAGGVFMAAPAPSPAPTPARASQGNVGPSGELFACQELGESVIGDASRQRLDVIGVDIGITGGIALLQGDTARVWDFPTIERLVGKKKRRRLDPNGLARLIGGVVLADYLDPDDAVAYVERAHASPRMGVSSAFAFGECLGLVVGILAHLAVPIHFVNPEQWKRGMGLTKKGSRELGRNEERDKHPSIDLARKLYPALHQQLNYAKHDGRAEALLIAHWGAEQLGL